MGKDVIKVEVSYALPHRQKILPVEVSPGTSIYDAVAQSGIALQFADLELESAKMGVFGKAIPKPKDIEVSEGDRIEIYRPLIADPKEVRKARAARVKAEKDTNKAKG